MEDRYLKSLLTVIALELLWLVVGGMSKGASAQSAATPVIITGIRLESDGSTLPVTVHGAVTIAATTPLEIEADRTLPAEAVPYKPSVRPGE